MKFNKINTIILNPSTLSKKLIENNDFINIHKVKILNTLTDNYLDEKELNNYELIIIDNLELKNISDENISLINHYKVALGRAISILEIFEQYFTRIPIIKVSNEWVASKDLLNIKISKHIEFSKRIFDTVIILLSIPVTFLLLLMGIILIKITSKGPIFFKQERVGKNGKPFFLFKLRTMVYNSLGHELPTSENDERVFSSGKFLRYTKIDELPQFYNVLVGQMSIVGPRPEKTNIVKNLEIDNPYYELRHLIRPGITGWAQVNNPKATPDQNFEKLEYDLFYIKNANLFLEILIIIRTIKIILKRNSL